MLLFRVKKVCAGALSGLSLINRSLSLVKSRRFVAVCVMAGLSAVTAYSVPAFAQEGEGVGEVRRIDPDAGKITIKHGAIDALQLPAMALVYRASPDLIRTVQPGDKITFTARREGDVYVIVKIKR